MKSFNAVITDLAQKLLCVCLCIFGAFMCLCVRVRMFGHVCVNACVWGEWCKLVRVHRHLGAGPGGWLASGCYDNCRLLLHCLESVAMLHKVNIVLLCPLAALLLVVLVIFGSGLFSGCT